jgi:hypothetical protein
MAQAQTNNPPSIQGRTNATKKEAPVVKPNLQYMREKDREPVRGKFLFHEVPGGTMRFVYKAYKGDQVEHYTMIDGEVYTIPLGVARHLNKNCWYPIHAYALDDKGSPTQKVGRKVRRCSFQSLEFVDIDDVSPVGTPAADLITIENV